jgi:hypothetical protein
MIWLTWRQLRAQALIVSAAVAVLAVALAATGGQLAELSRTRGDDFLRALASGGTEATVYYAGYVAVIALPAVIGVFWGAPLITRELETGTHRLVWNQSITRTRWLATKLAFTGLAAIAATGTLSLLVTWWSDSIDKAVENGLTANGIFGQARLSPAIFDARGIAPMGYAAFAFALGVTAGLLIRRTVPAMAVTLAVFVAVQFLMPTMVRAHLGPDQLTTTITTANLNGLLIEGPGADAPVVDLNVDIGKPGAWVIANETVDAGGKVMGSLPSWVSDCGGPPGTEPQASQEACMAKLSELGYRQRVTYQSAGRFWTLQAYDTAIFLGVALLLTGFCFWWIRHRLS